MENGIFPFNSRQLHLSPIRILSIGLITFVSEESMESAPLWYPILCLTATLIFLVLRNWHECKTFTITCYQIICQPWKTAENIISRPWNRLNGNTFSSEETEEGYELVASPDMLNESSSDAEFQSLASYTSENSYQLSDLSDYEDGKPLFWEGWIEFLIDKYAEEIWKDFEASSDEDI